MALGLAALMMSSGGLGAAWAAGPVPAGKTGVAAKPGVAVPAPGGGGAAPGGAAATPGPPVSGDVGYPTVNAALEAVSRDPDMRAASRDGWLTFEDSATKTMWSFAPRGVTFYPSAVRRQFVVEDGKLKGLKMGILCEAPRTACDELAAQFTRVNAEMVARLAPAPG